MAVGVEYFHDGHDFVVQVFFDAGHVDADVILAVGCEGIVGFAMLVGGCQSVCYCCTDVQFVVILGLSRVNGSMNCVSIGQADEKVVPQRLCFGCIPGQQCAKGLVFTIIDIRAFEIGRSKARLWDFNWPHCAVGADILSVNITVAAVHPRHDVLPEVEARAVIAHRPVVCPYTDILRPELVTLHIIANGKNGA